MSEDANKPPKEENEGIYVYKILLLGDSQVGKTSFILRFCQNDFPEKAITTVGIDVKIKYFKYNNRKIKFEVWDTAGQERFRSITKNCFKGADGILLLFDLGNRNSFYSIKSWITSLKESIDVDKIGILIVGNKCDIPEENRAVDKEMTDKMVEKFNVKYMEASAKNDINVSEAFVGLVDLVDANDDGNKKRIRNPKTIMSVDDKENDSSFILGKSVIKKKEKKTCCGGKK